VLAEIKGAHLQEPRRDRHRTPDARPTSGYLSGILVLSEMDGFTGREAILSVHTREYRSPPT
jgi:hypothetical protein